MANFVLLENQILPTLEVFNSYYERLKFTVEHSVKDSMNFLLLQEIKIYDRI